MTYMHIPSDITWHKKQEYIYALWAWISTVFEIFDHLLYQGDRITPYGHDLHTIRCYLTPETRIYMHGLRVGISTVFEIFWHYVYQGGGTGTLRMIMIYTPPAATWHKKQEYIWFRGGG
jgi:hypothetical protein